MSNYIVGLDFGTHQTKVCIEDSSNRLQLRYEFLEFSNDVSGKQSTLFPSIVQINKDGTVSYGFVKQSNAMIIANEGSNPPERLVIQDPEYLPIPREPKYEHLPTKPEDKHKGYFAILASLLPDSPEIKQWKLECASIERANDNRKLAWLNRKKDVIATNEKLKQEWQEKVKAADLKYQQEFHDWEADSQKCTPLRFRYFKQATFFYRDIWTNNFISPEDASIWYLAYIRFLLNDKLGTDYVVRMGVPCCYENIASFRQRAYNLWTCAGKLISYYGKLSKFLKADYKELLKMGAYEEMTIDPTAPFDVRTEAQASLFAAVSNQRLDTRINLLFDIGGGSTDVAVFHITPQNELKILETVSIPKGLNYIFESYQKNNSGKTLEQIQEHFSNISETQISHSNYAEYVDKYLSEISESAKILAMAIMEVLLKDPYFKRSRILDALSRNPSVFCGGGSMHACMRNIFIPLQRAGYKNDVVDVFTDRRVINESLLGIRNVKNKNIPTVTYQILATSYGLALSDNWYEVPSENIMNTFKVKEENLIIPQTIIPERNDDD